MPIQIKVEENTKEFDDLVKQLDEKNIVVANVRAINVAIRKGNTKYRKLIVSNYSLKYADTKGITVPKRATYGHQTGSISGTVSPISLSRFNPVFNKNGAAISIKSIKDKASGKRKLQQKIGRGNKNASGGVSFAIHTGDTKNIPFAFMVQSDKPGMSMQIWARGKYSGNKFATNKSRKPITALKTVSPFGAMTNDKVQKEIEVSATVDMQQEFERQVNFLLRK